MSIQKARSLTSQNKFKADQRRTPKVVRWTLYAFLFSLCFENFDPFGISASFTLAKMTGMLFAVACVWKIPGIFVNQHWTVRLLLWLWLWLAFVTFLGELEFPVDRTAFLGVLLAQAQCFLLYWLLINVLRDRRTAAFGLLAFTFSAAMMSILMKLGIGRQVYREGMSHERISFLGANANLIAIWSGIAILIIVGIVTLNIFRTDNRRYWLLLLILPMLVVMTESGSRGAAVSLILSVTCFLLTPGSINRRILIGLAGVGICLGFLFISRDSVLAERFRKTAETGSMAGREEFWPAAIRMIGERPLLGWGMYSALTGDETTSIPRGELAGNDPHNAFLAFFVFGGVFAGCTFLIIILYFLYWSFAARKRYWGILPLALSVFIISTLFKAGGFYIAKIPWCILAFVSVSCVPSRQQSSIRRHRARRISRTPLAVDSDSDCASSIQPAPLADRCSEFRPIG